MNSLWHSQLHLHGGAELSIAMNACLRRLHFEASTMVVAKLKSMAVEPSGGSVKRLPVAEKVARLQDQESRLKGLPTHKDLPET